jgi:hypothetical protein
MSSSRDGCRFDRFFQFAQFAQLFQFSGEHPYV